MGFNKRTIIIVVAIMGIGLQWLQSQSKHSQLRFDRSERVLVMDDFLPFARKAGEMISDNKTIGRARAAVQHLRGRLVNQFERATLVVKNALAEETTPAVAEVPKAQEVDGAATAAGQDEAAILAEKVKEKEEELKNVIGYDEEGNPIFANEEDESPDGEEELLADQNQAESEKETAKNENKNESAESVVTDVIAAAAGPGAEPTGEAEELVLACNEALLFQPDTEKMSKCISQYQVGQVSADVFYKIIEEMLADNRAPIRKLAAEAVRSTPSFRSFLILVKLNNSETFGSEISNLVTSALDEYATLRHLHVLAQVLTASDEQVNVYARIMATKKLDKAANTYIRRETASNDNGGIIPEGENSSQDGDIKTLSETQQRFQLFVSVLESYLATQPESDEAVSYATQALINIKNLLDV